MNRIDHPATALGGAHRYDELDTEGHMPRTRLAEYQPQADEEADGRLFVSDDEADDVEGHGRNLPDAGWDDVEGHGRRIPPDEGVATARGA